MKFRFGIGTAIALLLALAAIGVTLYRHHQETTKPPIIEREVRGNTSHGIAPVPEFLLRHRQELGLSDTQVQRITRIAAQYRKDIVPVDEKLVAADKNFQQYVERHKNEPRPDTQQIEGNGSEIQRLSAVKFATRFAYWQQSRKVLNDTQQPRADALAKQATLKDLQ